MPLLMAVATSAAEPRNVDLNKQFTLTKGRSATIRGTQASLRISGFINSPCPKGARCIWSGQAVNVEWTIAGATVAAVPYDVKVVSSDYKTKAALVVAARAATP